MINFFVYCSFYSTLRIRGQKIRDNSRLLDNDIFQCCFFNIFCGLLIKKNTVSSMKPEFTALMSSFGLFV
jgi:hypothetical protein